MSVMAMHGTVRAVYRNAHPYRIYTSSYGPFYRADVRITSTSGRSRYWICLTATTTKAVLITPKWRSRIDDIQLA